MMQQHGSGSGECNARSAATQAAAATAAGAVGNDAAAQQEQWNAAVAAGTMQ